MPSAYYSASISTFLSAQPDAVLGSLAKNSAGDIEQSQLGAWREEIELLQQSLDAVEGAVHLEYVVPRIGSRIDAAIMTLPPM